MLAEEIGGFVIFGLIQRCFEKVPSLRIHIRTIINGLLGGYNVSVFGSLNHRTIWIPTSQQQHGSDYYNELRFQVEPTLILMSAVFKPF